MEVLKVYHYGNGIVVSGSSILKISKEFIQILNRELPEEALCTDVIDSVLDEIKQEFHLKRIVL